MLSWCCSICVVIGRSFYINCGSRRQKTRFQCVFSIIIGWEALIWFLYFFKISLKITNINGTSLAHVRVASCNKNILHDRAGLVLQHVTFYGSSFALFIDDHDLDKVWGLTSGHSSPYSLTSFFFQSSTSLSRLISLFFLSHFLESQTARRRAKH